MQEGEVVRRFQVGGREVIFRYLRWADLPQFIALHRTLTAEKVMCRRLDLDTATGGRLLAEALNGMAQRTMSYLLAEMDGELIGEGFTQKAGHNYCTVGLAFVSRACGMGIGTQMMWALEEESKQLGATRLYLDVWSANPAAIHVYERVGYREIGRRPGWILLESGEECDLVEMVKFLEP